MYDGNLASTVVTATLTADTTLMTTYGVTKVVEDIYGGVENAPAEAYPFIAFSVLDQEDQYYNGRTRSISDQDVLIYGIQSFDGSGSYAGTLQNIADRIDALLHDKTLSVMDGATQVGTATIWRVSPYRNRYLDGTVEFRYLGGIYHISTNE